MLQARERSSSSTSHAPAPYSSWPLPRPKLPPPLLPLPGVWRETTGRPCAPGPGMAARSFSFGSTNRSPVEPPKPRCRVPDLRRPGVLKLEFIAAELYAPGPGVLSSMLCALSARCWRATAAGSSDRARARKKTAAARGAALAGRERLALAVLPAPLLFAVEPVPRSPTAERARAGGGARRAPLPLLLLLSRTAGGASVVGARSGELDLADAPCVPQHVPAAVREAAGAVPATSVRDHRAPRSALRHHRGACAPAPAWRPVPSRWDRRGPPSSPNPLAGCVGRTRRACDARTCLGARMPLVQERLHRHLQGAAAGPAPSSRRPLMPELAEEARARPHTAPQKRQCA